MARPQPARAHLRTNRCTVTLISQTEQESAREITPSLHSIKSFEKGPGTGKPLGTLNVNTCWMFCGPGTATRFPDAGCEPLQEAPAAFAHTVMELMKAGWSYSLAFSGCSRPAIG